MNELIELIKSHPTCIEAEYEQHTFDEIGFPWAVRSNHTSEVTMKFAYNLSAWIRFEVLKHHMVNNQTRFLLSDYI